MDKIEQQQPTPDTAGPAAEDGVGAARDGPTVRAVAQDPSEGPDVITGIHAFHGHGVPRAKGFWADAWSQVVRRPGAIFGLTWIGIVAFFAVFAPFLANGHPLLMWEIGPDGESSFAGSPLLANLRPVDWLLFAGGVLGTLWMLLPMSINRSTRLLILLLAALQAGLTVVSADVLAAYVSGNDAPAWLRDNRQRIWFAAAAGGGLAALYLIPFALIPTLASRGASLIPPGATALIAALAVFLGWLPQEPPFDYVEREIRGEIRAVYTAIPWSPAQRRTELTVLEPGSTIEYPAQRRIIRELAVRGHRGEAARELPIDDEVKGVVERGIRLAGFEDMLALRLSSEVVHAIEAGDLQTIGDVLEYLGARDSPRFLMGTDSLGQDVLSQMIHACRLSISIGLVSTGIAVLIGVTLGAIMGYFGGWVDLVLYRIVEIFMAIPVLFLLIVAAAVLPRNIYVMMTIIGCVTWTGAARFVRAEFYKLRGQDFVQSARAVGLPLRSILFKHMLPNGVTPVLVEASFAIALAILIEAILSFLGLGPVDQASWGRLLSDAFNEVGDFIWWLAIYPGFAIFLTVLSYNLVGEAMRDAIDPKLKKARV